MNRRRTAAMIVAGLALFVLLPSVAATPVSAAEGFSFGAVGDNGADGAEDPGDATSRTLQLIGREHPAFVQSLGDLAYDPSAAADVHDGADWCKWTSAQIARTSDGETVPYIIAAGNHEAQDAKAGFAIEDYTAAPSCADPFASVTSFPTDAATDAAKDSFYDYPADQPLLRVININPGLDYRSDGVRDYSRGSTMYRWVQSAIAGAKAKQEWVVLTYHVAYLNAGSDHGADMSTGYYAPTASQFGDIFALATRMKVDLILNGHEHNYQRSRQLRLSDACPAILHDRYEQACTTDADGSAAAPYARGGGPVQLIIGTGGHRPSGVDEADGDRGYMIVADAGADNCGYVSFAVSAAVLAGTFRNACDGTLADSFIIEGDPTTDPTAGPSPTPAPSESTAPSGRLPFGTSVGGAIAVGGLIVVIVVATIVLVRRRR
ncbi:MAG: metallophosphoesterase [Actinobacteria bacterium]|nr:metallophosphoesterase [Actinomycetota bacterium]